MQEETNLAIHSCSEVILLSPTGTEKTLAFLLPIMQTLDANYQKVQVLILVPSRELALQIERVAREMGTGFKTNAVYCGRAGSQDKIDLKHRPAILIGTPGGIRDHLRRKTFPSEFIHTLVLDEFDKSLEVWFEKEMTKIAASLPKVRKRILTSGHPGIESSCIFWFKGTDIHQLSGRGDFPTQSLDDLIAIKRQTGNPGYCAQSPRKSARHCLLQFKRKHPAGE